jgi:hypothetical protein
MTLNIEGIRGRHARELEERIRVEEQQQRERDHLDALRRERASMLQRIGRLREIPPETVFVEADTTGLSPTGFIVGATRVEDFIRHEESNLRDLDQIIAKAEADLEQDAAA